MRPMSVQAVGGYVQGLIDRQAGLTIASVSAAAGVEPNYIWRLRTGDVKKPSAEIVAGLVRAARGSIERAMGLLLDAQATEEDGRRAALAVEFTLSDRHRMALERLSDEDLDLVIALAERLRQSRATDR